MPDRVGLVAHVHGAGIAQHGRHQQLRQNGRLQERDIKFRPFLDDLGDALRAVGKGHRNRQRVGDHVQAGEDGRVLVDHHTAAQPPAVVVFRFLCARRFHLDQDERRTDRLIDE